ncbi:hypothetical protein M2277_005119 [Paenibacillus sp. LBL]|uniref:hypothetical protein n=1 Tax=Paenibacillus sp. LBL TaxID=2940563 RepID=UPI002474AEF0|nr:hypothetical protein [Paenibacillus sp. LBL]MDH6674427.1 hypothetical protein [Paenibacillus sp. LBL]
MHELVKLAVDAYKGTTGNFSKAEASETLRNALIDLNGGSEKIDFRSFRRNKTAIFEIIEETLSVLVSEGLENEFNDFAEVRNLAWGDTNVFTVPNSDLFKVAVVADGTNNLRRQRLDGKEFGVSTYTRGIKIYEELHRFLAGRIDWVEMVNRVAKSYNLQLAEDVYNAIYNSFSTLAAPYAYSGAYDEFELTQMAQHVEAASNGAGAYILGTKMALAKVAPSAISDNMREARNKIGYYGELNGFELREIKNVHKAGSYSEFAIDNNFLLIVPKVNDKFVKIVNEGDALIVDGTNGDVNADFSMEYTFVMKSGIAVIPAAKYGIYRLA